MAVNNSFFDRISERQHCTTRAILIILVVYISICVSKPPPELPGDEITDKEADGVPTIEDYEKWIQQLQK